MFAGASLDENSGAFCELKANFFRLILTKAEFCGLTSNVYTHLKLEDAQREMERLERIEKEMKKCAK